MNKGNTSKLQYRDKNDDLILSLGKKEFSHQDHQKVFVEDSCKWVRDNDFVVFFSEKSCLIARVHILVIILMLVLLRI